MRIKWRHEHVTVFYFGGNQEYGQFFRLQTLQNVHNSVNSVQNSNNKTAYCLLTADKPPKNNNTYNFQTHHFKMKPENNEMHS